jgi:hypothetical protein
MINNIIKGIHDSLIKVQIEDNTDRLIVSCLLYDYIKRLIVVEDKNKNNIKTLASSYAKLFSDNLKSFKQTYVSYSVMRRNVEDFKKSSFLQYTEPEINQINELYKNKTRSVQFSSTYFSQYMYKVVNLKYHQYVRLSNIHFNVMVPIIKFYMDSYDMKAKDLEIFDAELFLGNPGKVILFGIKDTPAQRVVRDILAKNINIDYYKIEVSDDLVKITIN